MQKKLKPLLRKIHLYVGLVTGLILFIVCFTGAIYTFKTEIQSLTIPELSVEYNPERSKLPLAQLYHDFQEQSDSKILRIYDFKDPEKSTMFLTSKAGNYYQSLINPYTGKILIERNYREDIFIIILEIHRNLLLGDIGSQIIGYTVLLFVFSLLIGLYLWYPSNKKILKSKKGRQSKFWIDTKAKKAKLWLDLHNVLGFYSAIFLIILSITGLVWSFDWVDAAIYRMLTFEEKPATEKFRIPVSIFDYKSLDYIDTTVPKEAKSKLRIIYMPKDSIHPLRLTQYSDTDVYGFSNEYDLDPQNGAVLKAKLDSKKNNGEKLRSLNYDIHTGSIFGFFGKLFVFIIALIGASLPITGVGMYIRKKRRKRKKKS